MKAMFFAIGPGIALLLPLAVYTGVSIFVPGPDWHNSQDFEARRSAAASVQERRR